MKAVKAVKTEEKAKGEKVKGDKAKAKVTKDKLKKAEKPKVQKAEAEAPRDTLDWPKGLQSPCYAIGREIAKYVDNPTVHGELHTCWHRRLPAFCEELQCLAAKIKP